MSESTERVDLHFACDASSVTWTVRSGQLREQLNTPYRLRLSLETDDIDAEPVLLLGQPARLTVTRGSVMRQVTGIVSEVHEGSTHPEMLTTNIVVAPALEALRHRTNTKIFQEMTVPDILEEVLGEGLGAYERSVDNRLSRTYPNCDYRVQYDESDLSFCSRLMEEEGIVYWFAFDGDAETLVLADSKDSYGEIASAHDSMLLYSLYEGGVGGHEYVSQLDVMSQMRPTKVVMRHFDWTQPPVWVEADSTDSDEGPAFDFPSGAHLDPEREVYQHDEQPPTHFEWDELVYLEEDAADQVRLRREAQAWEARVAQGVATVTGMTIGATFDLSGHPRSDLDGRYLVLGVSHSFDDYGMSYRNTFQSIPEDVPFRPKRITPKPRIESIQTAVVVGPAGEEIHTDVHGRIKVQFHWDRLGANDENSSRWVRVQQPWAGAGWGFLFIPRMGMEVIVDFVNGDPDQPVVVGCAYNGEHPPPYSLPDEKTKSTIKTETSLGGGGYNELRFEDKAGSEEIFTHAQKDQNEIVENDHTTTVHHDQSIRVDNDQTQEVGNDQTEHIFNNQSLEVDANRTIQVHANFDETVDGTETRQVTGDVSETFSANETRQVSGNMEETVSGNRTQTISGDSTETISGSLTQNVTGAMTINTPATYEITANGGFNMTTPAATTITATGGHHICSANTTMHDFIDKEVGQEQSWAYQQQESVRMSKIALNLVVHLFYGTAAIDIRGYHAELYPTMQKRFVFTKKMKGAEPGAKGACFVKAGFQIGPK